MAYIIRIPLFYQSSSYPFPTSSDFPTTTATYIALASGPPDAQAIFNDCKAWGWKVEHRHLNSPKANEWWEAYNKSAIKKQWNEDLWRIWQREHGVRILQEDAKMKGDQAKSMSSMQLAFHGLKEAGRWVKRNTLARESTEWELRRLEMAIRRASEASRRLTVSGSNPQAQASTTSLSGSVVERLEGMRVQRGVGESSSGEAGRLEV